MNSYVEGTDRVPRICTVQLSCHALCLERQPGYGKLFFVMTFDPEEGEMRRQDVINPKHDLGIHIDKLAFEYEPPKLCHLRREHRDVWTDGLGVAAVFSEKIKRQSYLSLQTLMSKRQRTFLDLVSLKQPVELFI